MNELNTIKINLDSYIEINESLFVGRIVVKDCSGKEYSFVSEPMVSKTIADLQSRINEFEELEKVDEPKKSEQPKPKKS